MPRESLEDKLDDLRESRKNKMLSEMSKEEFQSWLFDENAYCGGVDEANWPATLIHREFKKLKAESKQLRYELTDQILDPSNK